MPWLIEEESLAIKTIIKHSKGTDADIARKLMEHPLFKDSRTFGGIEQKVGEIRKRFISSENIH